MNQAHSDALRDGWFLIRRWSDTAETALQFLRAIARRPRSSPGYAQDSVHLMSVLPLQLAYRGRMQEAYRAIGNRPSRLFPQLALLGSIDSDTAAAVFQRWLAQGAAQTHFALPWWAERGDTASISLLVRWYDAEAARARAAERPVAGYQSQAARAYLLLARKDTSAARAAFSVLSDTVCLRCDFDHLTTARLLALDRQFEAADKLLRQRLYSVLTPTEIVMLMERGRVAQAMGRREVARKSFQAVVKAWSAGDREVRGITREAQDRIRGLGSP
jgi:hypothetical protein